MPRKLRELRAELRRAGFRLDRQKGSHQTWLHPQMPELRVILSGSDGDDALVYQERQIREAINCLLESDKGGTRL
ncbi:MAG: type II toxin-antitoxin system HicA family toxin [Thermomicrobiales bacterium]|jgi:predicted RNA binding protein YcfA (HicA-like mRNA interferase family)|nr:type II toxin-antitoxin system HicA family toxin [Thermomicrobiales bacterium]